MLTTSDARPSNYENRYIYANIINDDNDASTTRRSKLDLHADTCIVGPSYLKLSEMGTHVNVHGYAKSMKILKVPVGSAGTLWTDARTGKSNILVLNRLWLPSRH